jgi:hypothetical protein
VNRNKQNFCSVLSFFKPRPCLASCLKEVHRGTHSVPLPPPPPGPLSFGYSLGSLWGVFGESSGVFGGVFGESSGSLRGVFGESSGSLRGDFGSSGDFVESSGESSGETSGVFGESSGSLQGVFMESSGSLWASKKLLFNTYAMYCNFLSSLAKAAKISHLKSANFR